MIRFKNNTGGWYALTLEDSTGMRPSKTFIFSTPSTELTIPTDYAASVVTDPYAMTAYKTGMFTVVQGQNGFDKLFVDSGTVTEEEVKEIKSKIVPDAMLLAALRDGKLSKVQEYIHSPNLERLVQLAIDNIDAISKEKIDAIEQATGVSLVLDNE